MSAARHFLAPGTVSNADLQTDIKADITAARGAQKDLAAVGQYGAANRMAEAVDEHLDELNDAQRGTWHPRHA